MKVFVYFAWSNFWESIVTTSRANLIKKLNEKIPGNRINLDEVKLQGQTIGKILEREIKDGSTTIVLSDKHSAIFQNKEELDKAPERGLINWDTFPIE